MNIAEAKNLTKLYGDFCAVDQVSFQIKRGEIFGFLGPNGAGKTTTINMLTGLASITGGQLSIAGFDGNREIKRAQQVMGIVPDESNLYPELSGFDNLCFCAALYGLESVERQARARDLLTQVGLEQVADKKFQTYSKGMKRRLTIAAGLIHEPEILFLDEPTSGIDVESARQIRSLLRQLNAGGTTMFLTTHYIEEAERLCDRIAFIVQGKIVRTGSIDELMAEAQQEQIVEFSLDEHTEASEQVLRQAFQEYKITAPVAGKLRVSASEPIALFPFMEVFQKHSLNVYEAKVIRPSLEEVFVKITGLDSGKLAATQGKRRRGK
ncbi:MAG: ABC transporter ATP-binding protein [Firmicutes bacterium]|nr:ABC transporter ATP-binding protein [Bacillota bacterium]